MTTASKKCPLCRKPRSAEHDPFCSKACKDRDLLRWLDDGYALPGLPAPDADIGDEDEGPA
jgi:endogenous inhibitor of DNA gyrase (YacG/DUF329 family)